jgi:hypothetical protein
MNKQNLSAILVVNLKFYKNYLCLLPEFKHTVAKHTVAVVSVRRAHIS